MITDAEAALAARRAQTAQDRATLFIHVDDGRLMPNVARLRGHTKYRVFTGARPRRPPKERMAWLRSMGNGTRFANRGSVRHRHRFGGQLIAFAASEYGVTLDPSTHHNKMRAAPAGGRAGNGMR